jgi:hypothetical protein
MSQKAKDQMPPSSSPGASVIPSKDAVGSSAGGQDPGTKFKAAQAKAEKLGVHELTQEDIEGLRYEQIKQLRGY